MATSMTQTQKTTSASVEDTLPARFATYPTSIADNNNVGMKGRAPRIKLSYASAPTGTLEITVRCDLRSQQSYPFVLVDELYLVWPWACWARRSST